jgi:plastocyanin
MLLSALATTALVAVGCGGGNDNKSTSASTATTSTSTTETTTPAAGGAASTLKLSADPSGALKFDKSKLSAKAGNVTISMDNPSSVPHAIAVEGNGVDKDGKTVDQGGVSTVSVKLKAGTYKFYCPVDAHQAAGMKGTLTVK